MSEFEATTDTRQAHGHGLTIDPVLLSSATMRHSQRFPEGLGCSNSGPLTQTKTTTRMPPFLFVVSHLWCELVEIGALNICINKAESLKT